MSTASNWVELLADAPAHYLAGLTPGRPGLTTVAAETEVHLVYGSRRKFAVAHVAEGLMAELAPLGIVPELADFNLEYAGPILRLSGSVFSDWERDQLDLWRRVQSVGQSDGRGISVLFAGIPPTLTPEDLARKYLYPGKTRYDRLEDGWNEGLRIYRRTRDLPVWYGFTPDSICVTAAGAAAQPHVNLPSDPFEAARIWNAVMYVTPIVLAVCTNSPRLFGSDRGPARETRNWIWTQWDDVGRGRVFFGPGWVRSIEEVLRYYVSLPPFLLDDHPPTTADRALLRHTKSIWPFVRLIPDEVPHVENRAFPTEPPTDAAATMAFYLGLVKWFSSGSTKAPWDGMPFARVKDNFDAAVESGLAAEMYTVAGERVTARNLVLSLLPAARSGLEQLGIGGADIARYLAIIECRADQVRTGADWLAHTIATAPSDDPLGYATKELVQHQLSGRSMSEWPHW